jgi:amino acid transporter
MSTWLEFGLAIPRSGGEKNYFERVYQKPKYLMTCVLMAHMIVLGFSAGNNLAFGQYMLYVAGYPETDGWAARAIGVGSLTFAVLVHSLVPKCSLPLINTIGVTKVLILAFIVFSGFAALAGHRRIEDPGNFTNTFAVMPGSGGAYGIATAMLKILFSYQGWENANYVLGEIRNPTRTLRIAAPIALGSVTVFYVLANVAYFAAIPKVDLAKAEAIVAGIFFRNMYGELAGAKILPCFVALSNIGNVLADTFAQSRLIHEIAKSGLLPCSQFFASRRPFNSLGRAVCREARSHGN